MNSSKKEEGFGHGSPSREEEEEVVSATNPRIAARTFKSKPRQTKKRTRLELERLDHEILDFDSFPRESEVMHTARPRLFREHRHVKKRKIGDSESSGVDGDFEDESSSGSSTRSTSYQRTKPKSKVSTQPKHRKVAKGIDVRFDFVQFTCAILLTQVPRCSAANAKARLNELAAQYHEIDTTELPEEILRPKATSIEGQNVRPRSKSSGSLTEVNPLVKAPRDDFIEWIEKDLQDRKSSRAIGRTSIRTRSASH
jgi:hypothetical protein